MVIEILRIGQRLVRDDRVTTHVALAARAFGASKIYMNEVNPEIKDTLDGINKTWGGDFEISFIDNWKELVKRRKNDSVRIVHLTMYGEDINDIESRLEKEKDLLIVIGAEKVPREIFDLADYNVAIGNQPHSEISALAVLLDRILKGKKFSTSFDEAQRKIIPTKQGKNVVVKNTRN
ncbi:MAG: tRNA (cytidine(56)-2'-O)-methyltransferase [Thaumarchaeota archaeon]|nr:tRNA (cytidine(56)-2'-O)-methyltransferase [Nitrososphaerota archaeon]